MLPLREDFVQRYTVLVGLGSYRTAIGLMEVDMFRHPIFANLN